MLLRPIQIISAFQVMISKVHGYEVVAKEKEGVYAPYNQCVHGVNNLNLCTNQKMSQESCFLTYVLAPLQVQKMFSSNETVLYSI